MTRTIASALFIEVQFEPTSGINGVVTTSLHPAVEPGENVRVGFQGPITGLYTLTLDGRELSARLDPAYAVNDRFGHSLRYIPTGNALG